MTKQQLDVWNNCYDLGWQNLISPASFSHPAKFSRGLIFRIIEHALEDGLIQPGSTILDPFGGVALGALPALQNGLNWIGVELESKFVELGRQNIALWNSRFSGMPRWTGQAQLLQGDSRRLAEVVAGAGLVVSSPPYAESLRGDNKPDYDQGKIESAKASGTTAQRSTWGVTNSVGVLTSKGYGSTDGNLGNLPPGDIQAVISSPSFAGNSGGRGEASRNGIDAALFDRHSGGMKKGTGSDPANLDHLPMTPGNTRRGMGTPPIAIVSSPPYVDSMEKSGGIDPDKSNHIGGPHSQMNRSDTRYGEADGQLGAMKAGVAVVGSPPFENSLAGEPRNDNSVLGQMQRGENRTNGGRFGKSLDNGYSNDPANIGIDSGQTFWEAARQIVEQCALLLPPGGFAIWVVKNYVKAGREVDFTGQWQALCEACGFETVHEHRAMLVKENGAQGDMFGADKKNKVERKSFFRRLAEAAKKADAHWETLSNEDRAALIAAAYARLFEDYLAKLKETRKGKPAAITKSRLMREAKSRAWLRDGRLDYEIKTSIDFETILCTRKPA